MDEALLRLFLYEVEAQCEYVQFGVEQLDAAHAKLQDAEADATPATYFALQNILVAAGNISKLLWGNNPQREADRAELRRIVGATNDAALRSRDLRNHFEHVDERLETWHLNPDSQSGIYVGRGIGPFTTNPDLLINVPVTLFGSYDPATATVAFWDLSARIPDLAREAHEIHLNALAALNPS